jgi:hypothetical protein
LQAIIAPTKLTGLGRINAPKTNARPVNFERVVVNDARLPGQAISKRGSATKRCEPSGENGTVQQTRNQPASPQDVFKTKAAADAGRAHISPARYRIPLDQAGKAGSPVRIWPDRPIKGPDGMDLEGNRLARARWHVVVLGQLKIEWLVSLS